MSGQRAKETNRTGKQGNEHHDRGDGSRAAGKFGWGLARADGRREQPAKCRVCKARESSGQNAGSYAAPRPGTEVSSAQVNQIRADHGGGIRKSEDARRGRGDSIEDENRGCGEQGDSNERIHGGTQVHEGRRSPAAARMFWPAANDTRVRDAGPPRKTFVRPKAYDAPHPL